MKKLAILLAVGVLVVAAVVLVASATSARPGWGTFPACVGCHVDGGDGAIAVDLFVGAHGGEAVPVDPADPTPPPAGVTAVGSVVGECLTCHTYENETIHGTWTDLTEACARCHRTHSAAADDLLIMDKNALCMLCHGTTPGMAQTNVVDGMLRYNTGSLRGGGFENAIMNTDSPDPAETWAFPVASAGSRATTSEHSLGIEALIWGSGPISATPNAGANMTTLTCNSCHDPHAFGRTYRMLRPQPEGSTIGGHGSTQYAMVTDILAAGNLSYTTDDYAADIEGYAPDVLDETGTPVTIATLNGPRPKYSQQMNLWCASCHTRYHATKAGRGGVGTVPTGDAIFAYQHKTGDEVHSRRVTVAGLPVLLDPDASLILDGAGAVQPLYLDALATTEAHALDGEVALYISDTSPVEVLEGDPAAPVPVFLGDGTPVGNLLEQDYEHEAYSSSCGYGGANCHGSGKDFNKMLNCLGCHVSHGTAATMTPYAQIPWPGEDATTADGLPGTAIDAVNMANWLGTGDDDLTGQYLDSDWGARSSLLRVDNRGVCQNAWCHPKGNDNMHFGPDGFVQGADFDYGGNGGH